MQPSISGKAPAEQRPASTQATTAFHEIRSLGSVPLKETSWTNEQIQALMGHSNVAMTEHHPAGDEAPWQAVSTGIAAIG
ncbi:hypothetical protein [Stenotrophomonas humi]